MTSANLILFKYKYIIIVNHIWQNFKSYFVKNTRHPKGCLCFLPHLISNFTQICFNIILSSYLKKIVEKEIQFLS